ncbi:zonular occludens toxin [Melaminivora suipulveris]|uniref:Zonular occludens toxin n=1 Tax=Melaminivora suipulveris TaxID=2109913 RepID=A0A2R3Q8M6_9BURK|nr:zonular occludens toxin domain-containing protein [Melaminivora suipulveris]AVO48119.1 zonular occludens toxin [Melaminivora suipulveris]
MLTLITGVPGSGKTAGAVDLLLREYADRPLYVDGLNGLELEHVAVDVLDWPKEVPDGAVVVVDEVQRKWRPRGPGGKVPESVAALETHRHRGLDFILITQNPRLLDSNVRSLVGRHVHIRDTGWMGRWWYEWPECNEALAWAKCQNKRRYKLPRRVFDLYKSASLHTKPVRKVPLMLYILGAVLVALIVVGSLLWRKTTKAEAPALAPAPAATTPAVLAKGEGGQTKAPDPIVTGPPDERVDFIPRLSGRPWTAPAYDELRRVVQMPSIAGALCMRGQCTCFAQDGARLPEVGHDACAAWMQSRPFDPYRAPPPAARSAPSRPAPPEPSAAPSVSTYGGVVNPLAESRPAGPLYLPAMSAPAL